MSKAQSPKQLHELLKIHAEEIPDLATYCKNEAQTRLSLINPYLDIIGWNTQNPRMVQIENSIEIDPKNPQRVDYALYREKRCLIIIEAKKAQSKLEDQATIQLKKYFSTTNTEYAVMTNGKIWQWYQQEKDGKLLDPVPFLVINAENPLEKHSHYLWNIHPGRFDPVVLATEIQKIQAHTYIVEWLKRNIRNPESDFVDYLTRKIRTSNSLTDLRDPIRDALQEVFGKKVPIEIFGKEIPRIEDKTTKQKKPINETKKPEHPVTPTVPDNSRYWLSLTEWHIGHVKGKISNPLVIKMPDNSVHPVKSFRAMARLIIDYVNKEYTGSPDINLDKLYIPSHRKMVFATKEKPKNMHSAIQRARNLNLYFNLNQSSKEMVEGILNFLQIYGIDHNIFKIRRTG